MKYLVQVLLFCMTVLAGVKTHAVSFFQKAEANWESDNLLVINLQFDGAIDADSIKVKFINQTIQFDIPGAIIKSEHEALKINKNNLKTVYTYQRPNEFIRTRIIYEKPIAASDYEESVRYGSDNSKLTIKIKSPKVTWASLNLDNIHDIKPVDLDEELKKALAMKTRKLKQEASLGVNLKEELNIENKQKDSVQLAKTTEKKLETKLVRKNKKDLPESEIPVFSNSKKANIEKSGSISRMIISLLIIVVLGIGSILFSKWWSKSHKKTLDNNKIRVLTQHHLGPKKSLAIIRVAGESILIGVTDNNISMIKTLSLIDDEIPINVPTDFGKTLQLQEREKVEEAHLDEDNLPSESEAEQFAYGNIKNTITSKLKGMRQF